jgi:hypothetical protein
MVEEVEQFCGLVEEADEWGQEVGAVAPAEAGLGHGRQVVQPGIPQPG